MQTQSQETKSDAVSKHPSRRRKKDVVESRDEVKNIKNSKDANPQTKTQPEGLIKPTNKCEVLDNEKNSLRSEEEEEKEDIGREYSSFIDLSFRDDESNTAKSILFFGLVVAKENAKDNIKRLKG
jgi:hypothetical protein